MTPQTIIGNGKIKSIKIIFSRKVKILSSPLFLITDHCRSNFTLSSYVYDRFGFLMRFAYQYKYPIVKMVATISPAIRQYNPSTNVVPAALEAMTTEKG